MEKETIIFYLKYAMNYGKSVKIQTRNNKFMKVNILNVTSLTVNYSFINNDNSNSIINVENILNVSFIEKKDEIDFRYYCLEKKYNTNHIEDKLETIENYYLEILNILLSKEEENSMGYRNLSLKKNIYPQMFENLIKESENLLFYYFTKQSPKEPIDFKDTKKERLLIEQANSSQKTAIENALSKRMSIIEGPPGTGKTTTILNILANLIYQNKKVVVVSKNNSAIENVVEELEKMSIPKCYIRMGNSTIMAENLETNIENILLDLKDELKTEITENLLEDKQKLINIIEELNQKEEKLNLLIEKRNNLQEFNNQLRHVKKKIEAYNLKDYELNITKKYKKLTSTRLKRIISYLAKILIILEEKNKLGIFDKIVSYFTLKMNEKNLINDGIALHLLLEEYYLTSLIEETEKELKNENFEELKKDISDIYLKQYIPISQKILNNTIKNTIDKDLLNKCIDKIIFNKNIASTENIVSTEKNITPKLNSCKKDLLNLYPIVLTTVDSIISNYRNYFDEGLKVDYIIIDESSQCDILSALPVLYLAKNVIIVGDQKQLSAITDIDKSLIKNELEEEYDYCKENFLSTIVKTINPISKMLLEHYRCDYNIINYCNKYFYENKLKIYKDSSKGAMSIIDDDKGKYVEVIGGYKNEREIKTINEQINYDINNKFIITPFRLQADILREQYGKERCGTIHTFQGKGEKQVYFSAVLNNTKECINHLNGQNNLFSKQLINVAVSRAKDKFVLVADKEFFKKNDENMRNLIEYIEIYGDTIPDKTVCIFDYLYKEINSYQQIIKNIENPYEEKVYYLILDFLEKNKGKYKMSVKLPLAEFVSDKKFLDANEELKKFVLNNSHLDFAIYSESINKPLLAIEVDGKRHSEDIQKERDKKKEKILNYMNIPILRVPSKVVWNIEEFEEKLKEKLV